MKQQSQSRQREVGIGWLRHYKSVWRQKKQTKEQMMKPEFKQFQ